MPFPKGKKHSPETRERMRLGQLKAAETQRGVRKKPICPVCKTEKKAVGRAYCTECGRKKTKFKALLNTYGLTESDYYKLEAESGGVCAICGREVKLFVDHNHDTGEIRGLLCMLCNTAIGKLRDDPRMLLRAVMYLIDSGEKISFDDIFLEHGALIRLLIAKGLFTEEEYFEELVKGVEDEHRQYEARLSARYGSTIRLV